MYHTKSDFNSIRFFVAFVMVALAAAAILVISRQPGILLAPGQNVAAQAAGGNVNEAQPVQRSIDLGAGYRLEIDSQGSRIIPPPSMVKVAVISRTQDLGAGYTLVTDETGGRIIPPSGPEKVQASPESKVYIGGGYWLVAGPDGGQIIKEGAR